jgi:D-sedoheptulose 7-phosphate isomerase
MDDISFSMAQSCSPPPVRSSREYFEMYQRVFDSLPHCAIELVVEELLCAYQRNRGIFILGNGGSAALASHFACDLSKGTVFGNNGQKRVRVMALTDNVPLMTAWANDIDYDQIFAEQLRNFMSAGDIVFAISASGNSPNVLRALELARYAGLRNIGLAGFQGGKMKDLCDICVVLPCANMQIIEDFQLSVAHAVFSILRRRIWTELHPSGVAAAD